MKAREVEAMPLGDCCVKVKRDQCLKVDEYDLLTTQLYSLLFYYIIIFFPIYFI